MIEIEELNLFGPAYVGIRLEETLWWWSGQGIWVTIHNHPEFMIKLDKLPDEFSLTKLLVRIKNMGIRHLPKIDCYEGIPAIDNNSDFSERENYFLFSDGMITRFLYHKYYRAYDEFSLKNTDNYRWDGRASGLRCKRISKRLVDKLRNL